MKYLILLLLLSGCTSMVKSGESHDKTIFAVEGLGYGDYVTNGLIVPLQAKHKFNFVRISWGSECPASYPAGKLIAVGHSLGGPKVLECVKMSGREFDLVITLDARVAGQPYSAPKNSKRTVNYFQRSIIFPGYPVQGAEEHQVDVGHTQLPYMAEPRRLIEDLL